jgi:hypothetical protein
MRPYRSVLVMLLVVVAQIAALIAAGPAMAAPALGPGSLQTSVTLYSASAWVGGGVDRLFLPPRDVVDVGGIDTFLDIRVSNEVDSFQLAFQPPTGTRFEPRLYDKALDPVPDAVHPGISVGGNGHGCTSGTPGRFDVKDIGFGASGEIDHLWLTFEERCYDGTLSGEVRYRMPAPDAEVAPVERAVLFQDQSPRIADPPVHVWIAGLSPSEQPVTGVAVGGPDATDFVIGSNGCTDVTLSDGKLCALTLRFKPKGGGPRVATLGISDGSGVTTRVALDGYGIRGRSTAEFQSDPGDFVGYGRSIAYTIRKAWIGGYGDSASSVAASATDRRTGESWVGHFEVPRGQSLVVGRRYDARRDVDSGAGMDVDHGNRGCNQLSGWFELGQFDLNPDGTVSDFRVSFEQHCEFQAPALRGTFEVRIPVGDLTAPPAVRGFTARREDGRIALSWTDPPVRDLSYVAIRFVSGGAAPVDANSGILAFAGRGGSAVIDGVTTSAMSIAAFPVDDAGNLGPGVVRSV